MGGRGCGKVKILLDRKRGSLPFVESESRASGGVMMLTMRAARKRKMIRLKQIRKGVGAPREVRDALKALGLGELYKFSEIPDTKEVRALVAKVGGLISILDGPDILFPREKSTLGEERIRDMVEAVRASMK
jgi:large subunit ribosomal protein L30